MNPIRLTVQIDDNRRLIVDLPPNTPIGEVEILIHPLAKPEQGNLSPREVARQKLLNAGALVTHYQAPEGTIPLSPEELLAIGTLLPNTGDLLDIVNENRGSKQL